MGGWTLFQSGFLLTLYVMYTWWRDVIREATFEDQHTVAVQKGLRLGMILFIVSEVMFFFAFFWAFFHSSLAPVYNIGGVWPPKAITTMDTYTIPLTNTFFLLTSGATVTWAHHALVARAKKQALLALLLTLTLATLFTCLQGLEYVEAAFNISDGIYGSCFYMATGFHGFHVFVGTIALLVSFIRIVFNHFTNHHHFGFESAIWYWHFVDVVWLFLFINVYWWGNNSGSNLTGPASPSRLKIFYWAVENFFDYIEQNDLIAIFMLTLCLFLLISIYVSIALVLFYVKHSRDAFILKFVNFLKADQLSFFHKLQLIWFTISLAIPARVWVLEFLTPFQTFLWSLFGFLCLHIFPLVTFIVFGHFLIIFNAFCFIQIYKHSKTFRNSLLKHWFNNSENLMNQYIVFFWGNPGGESIRKLTTYITGAVSGISVERARNNEKEFVRTETSKAMSAKKEDGMTWESIDHYNEDKAETRRTIINDDTVILKYEEKAKEGFEVLKDLIIGSGN
jgi:cytochrome c oxidase subunit 3